MKKGFTLVEVLVVIVLIGLILIIAIPAMLKINRTTKERELATLKESLIKAAEEYGDNNRKQFGEETSITIHVKDLIAKGYINANSVNGDGCTYSIGCIMNPVTETSMNDETIQICKINSVIKAGWNSCNE